MLSIAINRATVNFIGDPHLGKRFNKVHMHRRGERELSQMKQFMEELNAGGDITIMVGDLFDTFVVPNELILEVAGVIAAASITHRDKWFILMSGNHDISRDAEVVSSFHLLKEILIPYKNVTVCMETTELEHAGAGKFLVCPYSEFKTSKEEVKPYVGNGYSFVVGHWDTMEIAGTHNLVPYEELITMTDTIITGHIHTPDAYWVNMLGQKVEEDDSRPDIAKLILTGSMQPYSHGEDPNGDIYISRTIEQVEMELASDPLVYRNKCLRLIVGKDEAIPDIDCLQLSVKTVEGDAPKTEVVMEIFNFKELFFETMKENEVPDDIAQKYYEIYTQKANDDSQS